VIVVDASIAAEILLGRPGDSAALERLFGTAEDMHAPHLFDAEVANVIRGAWLSRSFEPFPSRVIRMNRYSIGCGRYDRM
jgi:predicted nucleic acid-binding protein